jgi:hypothetical protein
MKSFYTLIQISPNPSAGDLITVGLLLKTENNIYLKFSESKIKIAQRYLGLDENLIPYFKKQLENEINSTNEKLLYNTPGFFDSNSNITADYFSYLNKISNNLIQFSKPSYIADDFTSEQFLKFYKMMVDKTESDVLYETIEENKLSFNVREKLIQRVENKIHTNIVINKKILPSLYFSLNIDCIGKNGSIVSAKSIDFNSSIQTIERNIIGYDIVLAELNKKFANKKNIAFVIADEPDQKESVNYNIWEALRKKELLKFDIVKSDESESVAEFIEGTNAHKFLDIAE